jgi:PAS domain-containing protein
LSYLAVLVFVIAIGILVTVQLNQISASLDNLTNNLAVDRQLANRIVSQALLARFYAQQFVRTQDQADVDRFNQEFARLEELLSLADEEITSPMQVEMLGQIEVAVGEYGQAFEEATQIIRERQRIQAKVLDVQGLAIEHRLLALRVHISSLRAPVAFLAFGNAQDALHGMRLYTSQYLAAGDEQYAAQFELSYQNVREAFSSLETALMVIAIVTGLTLSIAVVRHMAQREQAETALRESEEQYRTLFEGVPVGLYRSAASGKIIDANPALVRMLGYPDRDSLLSVDVDDHYVNTQDHQY